MYSHTHTLPRQRKYFRKAWNNYFRQALIKQTIQNNSNNKDIFIVRALSIAIINKVNVATRLAQRQQHHHHHHRCNQHILKRKKRNVQSSPLFRSLLFSPSRSHSVLFNEKNICCTFPSSASSLISSEWTIGYVVKRKLRASARLSHTHANKQPSKRSHKYYSNTHTIAIVFVLVFMFALASTLSARNVELSTENPLESWGNLMPLR